MRADIWTRFVPLSEFRRPSPAEESFSGRFEDISRSARSLLDRSGFGSLLRGIAAGRRRACILVGDAWFPAEYCPILEEAIGELKRAGIKESRITILLARGMRPPTIGLRPMRLYGEPIAGGFAIENAGLSAEYAAGAGTSPTADIRSVEKPFDPRWMDADVKVLIGNILPHPFVGWSGGADLICPGIAGPMIAGADRPVPGQAPGDFKKTLESRAAAAPPGVSCYIVQFPFAEARAGNAEVRAALSCGEGMAPEAFAAAADLARDAFLADAAPARDVFLCPPDLSAAGAVLFALASAWRLASWMDPTVGSRIWLPLAGEEEADEAADVLAAIERDGVRGSGISDPWATEPAARGVETIETLGAVLRIAFAPSRRGGRSGNTGKSCKIADAGMETGNDKGTGGKEWAAGSAAAEGGNDRESDESLGETVEIPDWAEIAPLPYAVRDLDPARTLYVPDPWRVIPLGFRQEHFRI